MTAKIVKPKYQEETGTVNGFAAVFAMSFGRKAEV